MRNCVIEAIAWYVSVEVTRRTAQREGNGAAVRRSLVGDIHQPLHAGFAEDRGGNSVEVRFNGRKENLHSLWDTALVELEQGTPAEIAMRIQATGLAKIVSNGSKAPRQIGRSNRWRLSERRFIGCQRRARSGASLAAADSVCDGGRRCAGESVVDNVSERISIEVATMEQFSLSQWVSLALECR